MATKRKRSSSSWEFIIRRKGVLPKPAYLTFSDEKEGDEYVKRVEALLDRGVVPPELVGDEADNAKTLADVIKAYQLALAVPATDVALLNVVRERQGDKKLTAINYPWAESWVASMKREDKLSPSTIRHYVGAAARCLDWLTRKSPELLPGNPLRLLPKRYATYTEADAAAAGCGGKTDQERDRRLLPLEEKGIREVLAGAKPEGRERPLEMRNREALILLFDLALETAMRMREMYTLDISQVDIGKRTVFLDKTKNGSKRQVPLSSVALDRLQAHLLVAQGPRVFPWWDGRPESMKAITALLSQQFSRVFAAAGCPDLRFHDLRHEATGRLFERTNLSDLQIAKITGHKDPRMLARYANLRGSDLASALW